MGKYCHCNSKCLQGTSRWIIAVSAFIPDLCRIEVSVQSFQYCSHGGLYHGSVSYIETEQLTVTWFFNSVNRGV